MTETVLEKRERIREEEIIMNKKLYQYKIGRSYNMGRIDALNMIGKTPQEIADLLKLDERYVIRALKNGIKNKD